MIVLAISPAVFVLLLFVNNRVSDRLVILACVLYGVLRSNGKAATVLATVGFILSPVLYFTVSVESAETVAKYTFYIIITATLAAIFQIQRPAYKHKDRRPAKYHDTSRAEGDKGHRQKTLPVSTASVPRNPKQSQSITKNQQNAGSKRLIQG